MWPDRVSNPGPLTYESGALPTALRGPASAFRNHEGSTFIGKDRNKLNYRSGPNHRIGPDGAGRE